MERQLDHQLDELRGEFLRMGAAVEESIAQSILALTERSDDVAREAIASNDRIDAWEVEIEEKLLALLATHQPVASDLRLVATMMKINYDLERMNDQAVNIAQRALELAVARKRAAVPVPVVAAPAHRRPQEDAWSPAAQR